MNLVKTIPDNIAHTSTCIVWVIMTDTSQVH